MKHLQSILSEWIAYRTQSLISKSYFFSVDPEKNQNRPGAVEYKIQKLHKQQNVNIIHSLSVH